jgi:hypothetical protein
MALVNMKMSAEQAMEYPSSDLSEAPKYPYGLSISLEDDAIDKLGIGWKLEVGDTVSINAKARVTSKSARETMLSDTEESLCLQITDMEVKPASVLYDK